MKNKTWIIVILALMIVFFVWQNTMSGAQKKLDNAIADFGTDSQAPVAETAPDNLTALCPIDIVPGVGIGKFKMGAAPDMDAVKLTPAGFPLHYSYGKTIGLVEIVRLQLMPDCVTVNGKKLNLTEKFDEVIKSFDHCIAGKAKDNKPAAKCDGNVHVYDEGVANNGKIPAGVAISLMPEEPKPAPNDASKAPPAK